MKQISKHYSSPKLWQTGYGSDSSIVLYGNGLSNVFKTGFTYMLPYLTDLGKILGQEIFRSGKEIFSQNNDDLKKNLIDQGKKSLKNITGAYIDKIGSGKRKKHKTSKMNQKNLISLPKLKQLTSAKKIKKQTRKKSSEDFF